MQTEIATRSPIGTATYAKLQSGDWGIRCRGFVPEYGERIDVTKKDGTNTVAIVMRVVWSGLDQLTGEPVALCAIIQNAPPRRRGQNASTQKQGSSPAAQPTRRGGSTWRGPRKPNTQPQTVPTMDVSGETLPAQDDRADFIDW